MLGKTFLLLAMATAAAATETGQDQGLAPFHVAQAAFDEAIRSFANVGPDHCYTSTSAAKLDIEELKLKFGSYRMALLKVDRTALPGGAKKNLKEGFKAKQKIFAATKRSLRTKKRAAKLSGKRCFWTRNPTPPPTQPPTEPPTLPPTEEPTQPPTEPPTPGPTGGPTPAPTPAPSPAPTLPPTEEPTPPPTQPPTELPTPGPTGGPTPAPTPAPTILELTYTANNGNFEIVGLKSRDCAARIEELQKYTYIAGNLYIDGGECTSIELNLLKGIGGYLDVYDNGQLRTFNANQLQSIGGYLNVYSNGQLGTLGLDAVNRIGWKGDQYLAIHSNQGNLCSLTLQDVCTSTTQVQGSKCSVYNCQ